jgi:hypothetical protein
MTQPNTHHLVDFASPYTRTHFKTLNAASALWRAESLQEDAEALGALKQEAEDKGITFGSGRIPYEILSYYAVGYATCLEWHARSRLVDTMLFRPCSTWRSISSIKKAAGFDPERFEDHYEDALTELINAKRQGKAISAKPRPRGENVVDLMDALKKSIASEATTTKGKKPRRAAAGQKEMLLPIQGKKPSAKKGAKTEQSTGRRKAG